MVPTAGWTWLDKFLQVVIVCMFPIVVLEVIYLSGPKPPADVLPRLVGIIAFLICVDFGVEELSSVRRLTIDSKGVAFRFLIHTEHRRWSDLEAGPWPPEHQGWRVISRRRNGRPSIQRAYRVTIIQARSILRHPDCPQWKLSLSTRTGLGLSEAPAEVTATSA